MLTCQHTWLLTFQVSTYNSLPPQAAGSVVWWHVNRHNHLPEFAEDATSVGWISQHVDSSTWVDFLTCCGHRAHFPLFPFITQSIFVYRDPKNEHEFGTLKSLCLSRMWINLNQIKPWKWYVVDPNDADLIIEENCEGYFLQSEQKRRLTATDPRGLKGESCVENLFLLVFLFDLFRSGGKSRGAKQGLASIPSTLLGK